MDILDHLQAYVPMTTTTEEAQVAGSKIPVIKDNFHCTLIGMCGIAIIYIYIYIVTHTIIQHGYIFIILHSLHLYM